MAKRKEKFVKETEYNLSKFAEIVGSENSLDDSVTLEKYSSDLSFTPAVTPDLVVKPQNAEQVQRIIQFANLEKIPLIPCSSRPPRFRGDTIPTKGGVIVDLSEMKQIIRLDKRNKVALIEPGVTFGELRAEAEKQGLKVLLPFLPRSTKSIIGSYLEREPILIPKYHWDMTDPLLCTEVVFGSGDLFRTGSAAGPGTLEEQWATGQAQKNPMGPAQTDFVRIIQGAQGTMGIVTWASVKLELLPKIQKTFFVCDQTLDKLIDFTYKILRPKLPDECLILNNFNLASILKEKSDEIKKLASELPLWILFYSIAGYEYLPEKRVEYIEKDIEDIANQLGVQPTISVSGITAEKVLEILSKPSEEPYWKLRHKGRCVDLFFLTTLDKVQGFNKIIRDEAEKYKYPQEEIGFYIQPIQHGRSCNCEFNFFYDPGDSKEIEKIKDLYIRAAEAVLKNGAFFSRPYDQLTTMVYDKCEDNVVTTLKKVKQMLDPNGIMNPGRLCF
ncbi:MAG: FAD-binding oxidoreductase [Candidatus Helarchaeota archaeon]|nr:FAD-binding oxidoreductase [Candidatus Helarchaeota archaeon]